MERRPFGQFWNNYIFSQIGEELTNVTKSEASFEMG